MPHRSKVSGGNNRVFSRHIESASSHIFLFEENILPFSLQFVDIFRDPALESAALVSDSR